MSQHSSLQDEIQIVDFLRDSESQTGDKLDFARSRGAFDDFRENQNQIQGDIQAALATLKQSQKPSKFDLFADLAVEVGFAIDRSRGRPGQRAAASTRLAEYRKQITTRRGAKRDEALNNFKSTLAVLGQQGEFNAREFNAMLDQLDQEQKVQDAKSEREARSIGLDISQQIADEKENHNTEMRKIREDERLDAKGKSDKALKEDERHNKVTEGFRKDESAAAVRIAELATQEKVAELWSDAQTAMMGQFPFDTFEGDPKSKLSREEQYMDMIGAASQRKLQSEARFYGLDPDDFNGDDKLPGPLIQADVVDATQDGLSQIGKTFEKSGREKIGDFIFNLLNHPRSLGGGVGR